MGEEGREERGGKLIASRSLTGCLASRAFRFVVCGSIGGRVQYFKRIVSVCGKIRDKHQRVQDPVLTYSNIWFFC